MPLRKLKSTLIIQFFNILNISTALKLAMPLNVKPLGKSENIILHYIVCISVYPGTITFILYALFTMFDYKWLVCYDNKNMTTV